MNLAQIILILQLALSLLVSVSNNPAASQEQKQQALGFATQAVNIAAQVIQAPTMGSAAPPSIVPPIIPPEPVVNDALRIFATNVSITTSTAKIAIALSARIDWQTNKPTNSKLFVSGGGLNSAVFPSTSGFSTQHSVVVSVSPSADYSYTIEAISSDSVVVKNNGTFNAFSPPLQFISKPQLTIEPSGYWQGFYWLTKIYWTTNGPSMLTCPWDEGCQDLVSFYPDNPPKVASDPDATLTYTSYARICKPWDGGIFTPGHSYNCVLRVANSLGYVASTSFSFVAGQSPINNPAPGSGVSAFP